MYSSSDDDDDKDRRVRTFVLISNLPVNDPLVNENHLRQTLRSQTVGMMRCLVDTESCPVHALALFESKEAAIDASEPGKVKMVHGADQNEEAVLLLRPIMNEKAAAPERTFSETITVQGERVLKSDLALTTGLAAVLKSLINADGGSAAHHKHSGNNASSSSASAAAAAGGKRGPDAVARWCNATRRGEDCPFGEKCWYVHKRKFQVTVVPVTAANRIRQRDGTTTADAAGTSAGAAAPANTTASSTAGKPEHGGHSFDAALKAHLAVSSAWRSAGDAVPFELVPLASADQLFGGGSGSDKLAASIDAALSRLRGRCSAVRSFFVKVDIPHGSPSDVVSAVAAATTTTTAGAAVPSRYKAAIDAAPQALKRDVTMHVRLAEVHDRLAVSSGKEAVDLLKQSEKVKAVLHRAAAAACSVSLRVEPFDENLWMPTSQYQILLQAGARRFVGAAQRTSWAVVDVCRRGDGSSAEQQQQQQLLLPSEQLGLVMDWRQTAQDSVKRVLGELVGAGQLAGATLDDPQVKQSLLCINIAVSAKSLPSAASAGGGGAAEFLPPRVLSVHDGDEALSKSSLLPFATKTARELRLLWRKESPVTDMVPKGFLF